MGFVRDFENVDEAFGSRDIQLSWVDVRYELECGENEAGLKCGFFERGISSSDSIVLGSALVPFGLIYPEIGVSSKIFGDHSKKVRAQLNLGISDVMGMPLECKFCDLELAGLKMLPRSRADDGLFSVESMKSQTRGCSGEVLAMECRRFRLRLCRGTMSLRNSRGGYQIRFLSMKFRVEMGKKFLVVFFVDKVLEMLSVELGEFVPRKLAPVWQILLSFFYTGTAAGHWCLFQMIVVYHILESLSILQFLQLFCLFWMKDFTLTKKGMALVQGMWVNLVQR